MKSICSPTFCIHIIYNLLYWRIYYFKLCLLNTPNYISVDNEEQFKLLQNTESNQQQSSQNFRITPQVSSTKYTSPPADNYKLPSRSHVSSHGSSMLTNQQSKPQLVLHIPSSKYVHFYMMFLRRTKKVIIRRGTRIEAGGLDRILGNHSRDLLYKQQLAIHP